MNKSSLGASTFRDRLRLLRHLLMHTEKNTEDGRKGRMSAAWAALLGCSAARPWLGTGVGRQNRQNVGIKHTYHFTPFSDLRKHCWHADGTICVSESNRRWRKRIRVCHAARCHAARHGYEWPNSEQFAKGRGVPNVSTLRSLLNWMYSYQLFCVSTRGKVPCER